MSRSSITIWAGVIAAVVSLLVLTGCSSSYMSDREYGFRIVQNTMASTSQPSDLFYPVFLPNVNVIIVGSEEQLHARMQAERVAEPVLWVMGKRVAGKVVVNEAFLGEQLQRLLHQQSPMIVSPELPGQFDDIQHGLAVIHRSFEQLETTPDLNAKISLSQVSITIVGSQQQFQTSEAAAFHASTLGYATPDNAIWLIGSETSDGIVVNTAVLGHELAHLLNFTAPAIAHPDMLNSLFAFRSHQ